MFTAALLLLTVQGQPPQPIPLPTGKGVTITPELLHKLPTLKFVEWALRFSEEGFGSFTVSISITPYRTRWHPNIVVDVTTVHDGETVKVLQLYFRKRIKNEPFFPLTKGP
jgi:hypothetical protein